MGVGRWIRRMMERDDGYEPTHDEVVTVGYVNSALAQIVVTKLAEAGIRAEASPQRAAYGGPIKTRIMCFADERDNAAAIIDEMFGVPDAAD